MIGYTSPFPLAQYSLHLLRIFFLKKSKLISISNWAQYPVFLLPLAGSDAAGTSTVHFARPVAQAPVHSDGDVMVHVAWVCLSDVSAFLSHLLLA